MEQSHLERKIQTKLARMFSSLEHDLDIEFPEKFKIRFSDSLCQEAENLFVKKTDGK